MYVFYVFFKIQKKHDFLRFLELLHTFSPTVATITYTRTTSSFYWRQIRGRIAPIFWSVCHCICVCGWTVAGPTVASIYPRQWRCTTSPICISSQCTFPL